MRLSHICRFCCALHLAWADPFCNPAALCLLHLAWVKGMDGYTNVWSALCLHHNSAAVHSARICAVIWHAGQGQLPSRAGAPALLEGPALPIVLRPFPALAGLEGRERAWCTTRKSAMPAGSKAQASADTC